MATERRIEPWPLALLATLASGMAVSLVFLWVAARQPSDRLVVNPAQAMREHNRNALAAERAAARGFAIALTAQRSAGGAEVEIAPSEAGGALPDDAVVALRRVRPDRTGLDEDIALERRGARWRAHVPLPLPGRWRLVARAGDGDAWIEREFALEVAP